MPKYTFSHNWFANLTERLWRRFLLPYKPSIARYLEIGVAEGQSLTWALENFLDDKPEGIAVGVDPFWPSRHWKPNEGTSHRDLAVANVCACRDAPVNKNPQSTYLWLEENRADCELHQESSASFMLSETREFDLCYVDGNHEAPQAMADMVQCFRLLRRGGFLVVDDAERRYRGGMPSVAVALDAFEHVYHGYFDVLYRHPKQVCYIKCWKRRRGQYPPTMEMAPSIKPDGPTGEE